MVAASSKSPHFHKEAQALTATPIESALRPHARQIFIPFIFLVSSALVILLAFMYGFFSWDRASEKNILQRQAQARAEIYSEVAKAVLCDVTTERKVWCTRLREWPAMSAPWRFSNADKLKNMLDKLDALLGQNDLEAKEVLVALRQHIYVGAAAVIIDEIEENLSQFDFEAAQGSLRRLPLEIEEQ